MRARPGPSRLASAAFDLFFDPWRRTRLRVAPLAGPQPALAPDRPLLLVANHTSWWDGFLLRDVHRLLRPTAALRTVMTERELGRFAFLRLLGAVPLDPASPMSFRRLLRRIEAEVAAAPGTGFAYFPQGKIVPAWRRPLGFRRGVELVWRAMGPCQVLPVALHVEALNHVAPTAFIRLGSVIVTPDETPSAERLERAVTSALEDTLRLLGVHGESAPGRLRAEGDGVWASAPDGPSARE